MLELLKILSEENGSAGEESAVRAVIEKKLEGLAALYTDKLGNLIAYYQGEREPRKPIMLSAHMDEVAFVVTGISEEGLLYFDSVGGVDAQVVLARRVTVGQKGIPGIIGSKPVHLMEASEKEEFPELKHMYIDIGARNKEEAMEHVLPGDRAYFLPAFTQLGQNHVMNKALDDRAGCALLIALIQSKPEISFTAVFTVQEEVGAAAARVAANQVEPHTAVVVETTTAADLCGVPGHKQVCRLGGGPVLSFMDRGMVYDRELYDGILKLAEERDIPIQSKEGVYGGNESRQVAAAGRGAHVAAISLPCRYLHSASCVLSMEDMDTALRLLCAILAEA